ncbi:MAG TPA: HAD-IIIA family hydrolase [Gammaproteobacteria bacterium]|nr:HAD-IIIA family hydrolase [Gammaproteobacteria bacterium]
MKTDFELLVFDWDGTLMDSEGRIVDCLEATFADLGLPPLPRDTLKDVIGLGLREAIDRLAPGLDEGRAQQFIECYRAHYLCGKKRPTELFPGALETLRELEQRGYMLAIATGKARRGLERSLGEAGCGELFVASRCADECFSKPHPQMLQELMTLLDTPPERTLMIGDTEYDMQMAQNAGTHALAVGYGVHHPQRLAQHGALACLDDICDIVPWLETWAGIDKEERKASI